MEGNGESETGENEAIIMLGLLEGDKIQTKTHQWAGVEWIFSGTTQYGFYPSFYFIGKIKWEEGRVSGTVYHGDKDLTNLLTKVTL